MADAPGTYNDGGVVFGSQVVTIVGTSSIAEDINIDEPTTPITRRNEVGVPTAEVLVADVMTGSMTLQLATAATKPPAKGAAFQLTDVGGTVLPFKVSKVGRRFTHQGETKVMVDFRQRYATSGGAQ